VLCAPYPIVARLLPVFSVILIIEVIHCWK